MPTLHSVPVYKVVKVITKIAIILYCYNNKKELKKEEKRLYPVAFGAALAFAVGVPTWDLLGLIRVGVKVFRELTHIPINDELAPLYLGKWPVGNGIDIYKPDGIVKLSVGDNLLTVGIGWVIQKVGNQGVAGEIAEAILEEFDFKSFKDFFKELFS